MSEPPSRQTGLGMLGSWEGWILVCRRLRSRESPAGVRREQRVEEAGRRACAPGRLCCVEEGRESEAAHLSALWAQKKVSKGNLLSMHQLPQLQIGVRVAPISQGVVRSHKAVRTVPST